MPNAIRLDEFGSADVLHHEQVLVGAPGVGEVLVRQIAVGLNFIDVYHRTGLYPIGLPSGLGVEAAGIVEEVGPDVAELVPGDRVAYAYPKPGAYADVRIMPADRLVRLPSWISYEDAAAVMLQGMTARYLLKETYVVRPGDTILVHAAAGGVGLFLCQWAKALGATVIGTVGSDEKASLAHGAGCDHAIVYTRESFLDKTREITGGKGVAVVYDSVGRTTFTDSLDCLRPRGLMVSYGQASGPIDAFNPGILATKGSLYLTRPTLFTYIASRRELLDTATDLFEAIRLKQIEVRIGQRFPLARAAEAHRALESRKTTGSTILLASAEG